MCRPKFAPQFSTQGALPRTSTEVRIGKMQDDDATNRVLVCRGSAAVLVAGSGGA